MGIRATHSALKLEKSAISKVQKHIFCYFKNGKKSIFARENSLKTTKNCPKIAFLAVLNFFPVQKLIFGLFKIAKNIFWSKIFFLKLIYLISRVLFAWIFLNFLDHSGLKKGFPHFSLNLGKFGRFLQCRAGWVEGPKMKKNLQLVELSFGSPMTSSLL